jgi:predicted Fe-S protein YdhL (DUF1289 family)
MQTSLPFVFWIAIVTTANSFVANGFAVVDTAISPHQSRTFGTSRRHYRHHHHHHSYHDESLLLLLSFESSKQGRLTMSRQAAAEDPSDNSDDHNTTNDTNNNNNNNNNNIPVTPCNRICRYNANVFDGQVCIGCYRDTHEISSWASMDATERYWTLLDAMDRIHDKNNGSNNNNNNNNNHDDDDIGIPRLDGAVDAKELMRQAKYWESVAKSSS